MMNYTETISYMYDKLPMFTRIGEAAIKKDLTNTLALCQALGQPQEAFKTIHIAGTNGKGSVSHLLASILQSTGLKVGLYTSPHLLDFRERMRVNGQVIPESSVIKFIAENQTNIENIAPSFFELTVAMAFDFFRNEKVDIAVIETGLGGRLDSTNIILPELSIITNISFDHQNLLGNTLPEIAFEKAGIIKEGIPVVIGKSSPETAPVFIEKAKACHSNITFAEPSFPVINYNYQEGMLHINYQNGDEQIHISSVLAGLYQIENIATVLTAVKQLNAINIPISDAATIEGIKEVKKNTGFLGRWEIIRQNPLIICDVAHNEAGLKAIFDQLKSIPHAHLHFVYGMVKDKDIEKALQLLPREATYYFTQPQLPRALDYLSLHEYATNKGLQGNAYPNIAEACAAALVRQKPDNILLISGSIFVVAEALEYFQNMKMYQTN